MRRALFSGVLCVWLVMIALLVRRTLPPAESVRPAAESQRPASIDDPSQAGEEWMGVYYQEQKIGYTHHSVSPDPGGVAFSEESLLRLSVMETPQVVRTRVWGHAGFDYALHDVEFSLTSGVGNLQAKGTVEAGQLRISLRTGRDVSDQVLPLTEPIYLPSTLRASLRTEQLAPGRTLEAAVFDPTTLKNDRMRVTVERQEPVPSGNSGVQAWRVREEFRGLATTAWIDGAGTVWREEGPMGFVLRRETADQAMHEGWPRPEAALDLVAKAAVPVTRLIDDPRQRRRLRLRLSGIAVDSVPSDAEQVRHGAVLSITRPPAADIGTYVLPYRGEHAAELAATTFLQSDHPRVQALVHEVIGDERDAKQVAQRLNDWVYAHLHKVPTISIPNALQVLEMGEGDCNEHAVLLAALGRAAGVPTRVVAGAVYLDGAFFYHAWCEVWLSGWVSIDPTFDQFPADATHIKFVEGGPEDQVAMLSVIGRLGIEVLDDAAEAEEAE